MPFLQLHDSQFPLFVGETRVGKGVGADVRLPGSEDDDTQLAAVITLAEDHSATIARPADALHVLLNGIELGAQPSPLMHGDRVEFDGVELRFADEMAGLVTGQMPAAIDPSRARATEAPPSARSGGRLVSLVDGREYRVGDASLTVGRDAGCDVVVASNAVSRRHARLELAPDGYVLVDTSTNGVLVNGARVQDRLSLGRGDTIKIGPEEFRFHADAVDAHSDSAPAPIAAPPPGPSVAPPAPPPGAMIPSPSAPGIADPAPPPKLPPEGRPPLAILEIINEGVSRGMRYEIVLPVTHVGRGAHNEIAIADESVSDTHATIQRRERGWFVVDAGSTNGTYVAGERVLGEAQLLGNVDVRFGGVKVLFRAMGGAQDGPGGTRVIVGLKGPEPKRVVDRVPPPRPRAAPLPEGPVRIGVPRGLWIALVALAILIVFLILQGS